MLSQILKFLRHEAPQPKNLAVLKQAFEVSKKVYLATNNCIFKHNYGALTTNIAQKIKIYNPIITCKILTLESGFSEDSGLL